MATDFKNIGELMLHRIQLTPDAEAYSYPVGKEWQSVTWKQLGERVRNVACGLRSLGLQDEQRCAILSGTRFDWVLVDLAILASAGATTTIYPSNTAEECAYIINDSDTGFVFAENDEQVAKLSSKRAEMPKLKKVITFDGKPSADGWVITLAQLEELGRAANAKAPGEYEQVLHRPTPKSLATLIYTSGTTGKPKGVELLHDCWLYEAEGIDALGVFSAADVQYFWLPLAHSFGKVLEMAQLRIGFRTAIDGRIDKLVENLAVVKPTVVAAVPRIFEKVYNKVVGGAQQGGGLKYSIFKWSLGVGRQVSSLKQSGKSPGMLLGLKNAVADKLVFSKLRDRFGGRIRFFISGSAPLSRELAEFFHACNILILEGYGLTESSAASFVNVPTHNRFGTVGPPLPGTEVKIAPEDGEILIRGRGIMRGYRGLPAETAEALDKDGWLHTGDIGEFKDNFLRITDRKKDLIKTSGGKYVAPQALEGKFKTLCPYISNIVVHGNNRNFCSALLALDEESIKGWAKSNGLGDLSYAQLTQHEKVRELMGGYVDQLNATLASYETVKKFAILPKDLTIEDGDLTPSQKVKRKAVEAKYRHLLDGFYAGAVAAA